MDRIETIKIGDQLIIQTSTSHSMVTIRDISMKFKKYKFNINLRDFVGLIYGNSYEVFTTNVTEDESLAILEDPLKHNYIEINLNSKNKLYLREIDMDTIKKLEGDFTEQKYTLKKAKKKLKFFTFHKLSPNKLLKCYYPYKIFFLNNSMLAYIKLFFRDNTLIIDDTKGVVPFTHFYSGFGGTYITKKGSTRHMSTSLHSLTLFEEITGAYESVIICGSFDTLKILNFYDKNIINNIVIYSPLREQLLPIYQYLIGSNSYININLIENINREYQVEHIHPMMKGTLDCGYLLYAKKCFDKN